MVLKIKLIYFDSSNKKIMYDIEKEITAIVEYHGKDDLDRDVVRIKIERLLNHVRINEIRSSFDSKIEEISKSCKDKLK